MPGTLSNASSHQTSVFDNANGKVDILLHSFIEYDEVLEILIYHVMLANWLELCSVIGQKD